MDTPTLAPLVYVVADCLLDLVTDTLKRLVDFVFPHAHHQPAAVFKLESLATVALDIDP